MEKNKEEDGHTDNPFDVNQIEDLVNLQKLPQPEDDNSKEAICFKKDTIDDMAV